MYTAAMRALAQEAVDARAGWSEDDVRWLTFQLLGHPQDANLDILLESQDVTNGLSLRDEGYDEQLHNQFELAAREWRLRRDRHDAVQSRRAARRALTAGFGRYSGSKGSAAP